ncbi:MAG: hypothetical protein ACR2NN_00660 [Bryobacteraceae bacterium]
MGQVANQVANLWADWQSARALDQTNASGVVTSPALTGFISM